MKPVQIGGQVVAELDQLILLCNNLLPNPTSYLEVGAREGTALNYFVRRVISIRKVVVIDWPGVKWGRKDSDLKLLPVLEGLQEDQLARYQVILGDSHAPCNIEQIREWGPYDVVFIDGDHSPEGVEADLHNYGSMAKQIICMHDVDHPEGSKAYACTKLFNERRGDYRKSELISVEGSRKGIGVMYVD